MRAPSALLEALGGEEGCRRLSAAFYTRIGKDAAGPDHEELAARWSEQRVLDGIIAAIVEGRDDEALALAPRFASRPSVFVGLLARMVRSGRARLIHFVIDAAESDPSLAA